MNPESKAKLLKAIRTLAYSYAAIAQGDVQSVVSMLREQLGTETDAKARPGERLQGAALHARCLSHYIARVRADAKKAYERKMLERFLQARRLRARNVIPCEAPDFVLEPEDSTIAAIEVSNLTDPNQQRSTAAMERVGRAVGKLLDKLCVFVVVRWHTGLVLESRLAPRIAELLAAQVRTMAAEGREDAEGEGVDRDLAPYVDAVSVLRAVDGPFVHTGSQTHIGSRSSGVVQRALDAKEKKLVSYRAAHSGAGVWLLLVTASRPSETLLPVLIEPNQVYRSSFDRVFLLDAWSREVREPPLARPIRLG